LNDYVLHVSHLHNFVRSTPIEISHEVVFLRTISYFERSLRIFNVSCESISAVAGSLSLCPQIIIFNSSSKTRVR